MAVESKIQFGDTIVTALEAPELHAGAVYFMDSCVQNTELADDTFYLLDYAMHCFNDTDGTLSALRHCTPAFRRTLAESLPYGDKEWAVMTAQTMFQEGHIPAAVRDIVAETLFGEPKETPARIGSLALQIPHQTRFLA
jgi:hypothetical protein